MLLKGGYNIYGIPIGVLSLDSYFAKPPGHIKNATTFTYPVRYKIVQGATLDRLIDQRDPALLHPFIEAVKELEQEGVRAITGSCGFLALFQKQLADAVNVPVFMSSIIQVPMVYRMLKSGQKVGILTANKSGLSDDHLKAVGAENTPVCIAGMEDQPEFSEVILRNKRVELDFNRFEAELLGVAEDLVSRHPEIGAMVLECTDMPFFSQRIQQRLNLPVFDIITLTNMVQHAVAQKSYTGIMPR